jgi:hypothetical protein
MRYSVYNHVNRATELRRGQIPSGSYAPVESILVERIRCVRLRSDERTWRESDRSAVCSSQSTPKHRPHGGLSPLFPTPISYRSPCLSPISHALTSVT